MKALHYYFIFSSKRSFVNTNDILNPLIDGSHKLNHAVQGFQSRKNNNMVKEFGWTPCIVFKHTCHALDSSDKCDEIPKEFVIVLALLLVESIYLFTTNYYSTVTIRGKPRILHIYHSFIHEYVKML